MQPLPRPAAPLRSEPIATVLIVEDSMLNRRLLSTILTRAGYSCLLAADGESGLEMARAERPDLILLDIVLPGVDGYEVCRALKGMAETAEIPVLFLSALSESSDKVRGFELGAADYMPKPFDREEVLARVRTHVELRRLTETLRRANEELTERQQSLEEDLRAAAGVQRSLLPRAPLSIPGLSARWRFEPCESLGGDIFNLFSLTADAIALYVLDVSGHGTPSALITAAVAQSLSPAGNLLLRGGPHDPVPVAPSEVLAALDREYPIERFDRFFTLAYLIVEPSRGRLRYSTGGHPPPLLLRRDGDLVPLAEGGPLIGLCGELPFADGEVEVAGGDRLLLYTDGILELPDRDGELFGAGRLERLVNRYRRAGLDELCDGIMQALKLHSGGLAPRDDISLLAVEIEPPPGGAR